MNVEPPCANQGDQSCGSPSFGALGCHKNIGINHNLRYSHEGMIDSTMQTSNIAYDNSRLTSVLALSGRHTKVRENDES